MRKTGSFGFVFALFSILWTGVAILLLALFVPDVVQDYMVVKNGEKIEAIVTGAYEDTSYSENGKHYWYMTYQYQYNGETYKGETSSSYDVNEVLNNGDVINILYYDGRTVQEDYTVGNSIIFIGIFVVISLGVGVGMGIAAGKSFGKTKKMKRLKDTGTKTMATFVSSYSNVKVNNVSLYTIKYTYKDKFGIERTEESLGHCTRDEAEYLEALTEFQIAYADGMSVIVEDLVNRKSIQEIIHNEEGDMEHVAPLDREESAIIPNMKYECPSCGAVSEPTNEGLCQYCGSRIK